jgi:amidase
MDAIWQLTATELARRIQNRDISAQESAQSALHRLAQVNPRINAVVQCNPDHVMEQAHALDARIAAGHRPGPLAGVPVTIKVNVDQLGYANTNGLRKQADLFPLSNSPVVDAFLAADALLLGRTNTPAFSYRWFTDNLLHGPTFNPHNRALTPGGSSGGAAAAVSSGIGAIGHGTDIAGSIRYPAYACGIHGLRPSFGRVAAYNASTGDRTIGPQLMAVSGPLARSIEDLRLALTAMSRQDLRDPWWVPAPLIGNERPLRIALCVAPEGLQVAPEVAATLQHAASCLRDAGYQVEELDQVPPLREAAALQTQLWMGDGFEKQFAAAQAEGDPGAIAALSGQAAQIAGLDLALFSETLMRRVTLTRQWELFLANYSALLIPVSAEPPFPNQLDTSSEAGYRRVWEGQLTQIGIPFMGLPGLTVSTRANGETPMGVQLVASRFREDLLLSAGQAIASRCPQIKPINPC